MPVNRDAVENLVWLRVTAHLRADDSHIVAGIPQCTGFLPDPSIKRHGKIFDDDEDA